MKQPHLRQLDLNLLAASDVILTIGERLAKAMPEGLVTMPPPLKLPGFTVMLFWHERNRTYQRHRETDAIDPNLTLRSIDHGHFRLNQPNVTNVIVDSLLARDRTVNRCPLNLITR